MAINYVPLDKNKHSDWKISSKIDLAFAAKTHLAAATIREYAQLSGSMPIVFIEDAQSKNVHSVALKSRQQFLSDLANSEVQNQRFIKQLQENDLLEEIQVMVNYTSGQKRNVTGILSVSEKKLLELSDEKVLAMHKAGYLGAIYSVMLSLGQLNRLVELSNKSENPIQSLQLAPATKEQAEAPTNA